MEKTLPMIDENTEGYTWITNNKLVSYDLMRTHYRGRPKATAVYTVEELEKMGLFGWYKKDSEHE